MAQEDFDDDGVDDVTTGNGLEETALSGTDGRVLWRMTTRRLSAPPIPISALLPIGSGGASRPAVVTLDYAGGSSNLLERRRVFRSRRAARLAAHWSAESASAGHRHANGQLRPSLLWLSGPWHLQARSQAGRCMGLGEREWFDQLAGLFDGRAEHRVGRHGPLAMEDGGCLWIVRREWPSVSR